jgi:hypothetical protein
VFRNLLFIHGIIAKVNYSKRKNKNSSYLIAPSMLKKKGKENDPDEDYILLLICRTLCNNPHTKIIVWQPGSESAKWVNLNTEGKWVQDRYCDFNVAISLEVVDRYQVELNIFAIANL